MTSLRSSDRARVRKVCAAVAGGLLVLVLVVIPPAAKWVEFADRQFGDSILARGGGPPERQDFVLLGIDDASKDLSSLDPVVAGANPVFGKMAKRFPWDRSVWAAVIDRLAGAGARLIVIDLAFSEPSDPEADKALADAILRHQDKVILISNFSPVGAKGQVFRLAEPIEEFFGDGGKDTRCGYANFRPTPQDGLVRTARYTTTLNRENSRPAHPEEPVFRSLAGEIIVALGGKAPEGDKDIRFAVKYPPNADVAGTSELREKSGTYAYAPRSIQSIFVPKSWRLNYADGGYFRDKVVMIGPTSPLFQDIHQTPVGQLTGPQLHLQAAASGLAGAFDERVGLGDARYNAVTAALGMLVAALWAWWVKRPMISAGGAVAFMAVVVAGVIAFGIYTPWILGITAGVGAFGVGWLAALSYDLVTERLERGRLNREFRRFVSRDVADMLVREPEMYQAAAAGRRRRVVVLFSDVRGFTSRSEKADPAELVGQLNEYLTKMVDVVFRHEGTLDKFIGDAVMAHWGALEDNSDATHATRAVEAAKAMIGELDRLNEGWKSEDRDPFKIGIGLHIGEVVSGEIGCAERTEFGVIGDAVNLASRIEGLTKHYSAPLLISGAVAELIDHEGGLRCVGRLRVKGRREPVVLFTPGLGPENDGRFAEALRTFEAGDFARAAEAFAGLVREHPDDGPAAYLMRCAEIYVAAPPEGWHGVIVMESK